MSHLRHISTAHGGATKVDVARRVSRRRLFPSMLLSLLAILWVNGALSLLRPNCITPPHHLPKLNRAKKSARGAAPLAVAAIDNPGSKATSLGAVSKRQTMILDGSELASLVAFIASEEASITPDVAARAEKKLNRVAALTIAVGTAEDGRRVVGVERSPKEKGVLEEDLISLGDGTDVYLDSAATVPKAVSDADAISTAAAAMCSIHCSAPRLGADGIVSGTASLNMLRGTNSRVRS